MINHIYICLQWRKPKLKKQQRQIDLDSGRLQAPPKKRGLDPNLGGILKGILSAAEGKATRMAMAPAEDKRVKLETMLKKILKNNKRPEKWNYNINISLSDVVSMDWKIPDTRPKVCKTFG